MEDSKSLNVVYDFCNKKTISTELLEWLNPPASCALKGKQGLSVVPKPGSDFWCKTYRDPPTLRLSGHALLYKIPLRIKKCIVEMEFHLKEAHRSDQAGIMLYMDRKHWIKSSLKVEPITNEAAMSCVITNKYSDSNKVCWPTREARMRIVITRYREALDCKVEYHDRGAWESLRKGFIELPEGGEETAVVKVGLYCAAPTKKETDTDALEVFFKSFSIQGETN